MPFPIHCVHTKSSFKAVCFEPKTEMVLKCHKKYQAHLQPEPGMQYGFMITSKVLIAKTIGYCFILSSWEISNRILKYELFLHVKERRLSWKISCIMLYNKSELGAKPSLTVYSMLTLLLMADLVTAFESCKNWSTCKKWSTFNNVHMWT